MQKPRFSKKLVALGLSLASAALALGTPAGTVIQNIAMFEFNNEDGTKVKVPSPPVTTTVVPVCSPSVLPNGTVASPGQVMTAMPGNGVVFQYTLTNASNSANTFSLSVLNDAASQFTSAMTVYQDTNGNGQIDSGESPITQLTLPVDGSANLLVRADTPGNARGNAYVNLVAACATNVTGAGSERDDNNVARINLTEPPAFAIAKTFTPAQVKPGGETTVNITASNSGGVSKEVTVSDFLKTPAMREFTFISASARLTGTAAGAVLEYSADGNTWSTSEPSSVVAVRARASSMTTGTTLGLNFRLKAPEADLGTRRNIAQLVSTGQTIEGPADVTVKYYPVIALGPINNPEANPGGEMSADDRQVKAVAVVGQALCFSHTVKNLGERDDTITTTGAVNTGAAGIVFRDMNGNKLSEPFSVTLAPQATSDFKACYTPTQTGGPDEAIKVTLTSTSGRGAANNSTVDVISTVAENRIKPVKTGNKGSALVAPGDQISYALSFTNSQSFALNNVVLTDNLKNIEQTCGQGGVPGSVTTSTLDFISADQGGTLDGTNVIWKFAAVQPGQAVTVNLKVKVPDGTPDCASITNVYTVTSDEINTPLPSNPVINPVFNPDNLTFSKTSTPSTVVVGEEITYIFTVTNKSTTMPLNNVAVDDVLPEGLSYVEGSSTLDGASITPVIDPANPRHYTWTVPGLAVNGNAEIRFRALVTPGQETPQLVNNATATAVASGRVVKTPTRSAVNKILPLSFGPNNADVVGYVFQDLNRNGVYDYGKDIPVQNARVILANGRTSLTDQQGRYHFRNVREGNWALRLDPNSTYFQNLNMPQDAGLEGSRSVYVRNLTSVDFPLAPDAGDIAVIRDTTLNIKGGPANAQNTLAVRKQVFSTTKDTTLYTVQLMLTASAPLHALTLTDPLPEGAQLVSGQNVLNIDPLPGGIRSLTYSFRYTGDVKGAVTDPAASWRY
ncbi:SdrD B-like domain-containing protein [Deinococcus sp.]|uniref:SdrD B-like domain-containing protein n=1 Tax=Deinococcus sp. TaxID=47478 RepID=UPI0025C732AB|nr:SdrD B-like domain-containing protein [Deinococcus sp.]